MNPMTPQGVQMVIADLRRRIDQLEQGVSVPVGWDRETGLPNAWKNSPSVYEVLELAEAATADGYPRGSGIEGGGRASVLDEEGDPMPPVSDPTGNLATELVGGGGITDSIRYHRDSVWRGLNGALGDLALACDAIGALARKAERSLGEEVCIVHARHFPESIPEPVYRSRRCRWCYDFSLAENIDPPKDLLEKHDQGVRMTQRMVAEAVAEERKARRESNKKRKQKAARR